MKNISKWKKPIMLFLMIIVSVIGLIFVGCGSSTVSLIEFPANREATCKIGTIYTLDYFVSDSDGNLYALDVEVKDSTGTPVEVMANSFEAVDFNGYTITYTVKISEEDIRTSVVTLSCYDGDAPIISIGGTLGGTVGEVYTLPKIDFIDANEIVDRSIKVYFVGEDSALTEISSLDEKDGTYTFVPDKEGTYRISAYAKDSEGNELTRTLDFDATIALEGEIFNPACKSAKTQLSTNVDPSAKYEYVSAEENTDATYGGAYWRIVSSSTNWTNIYLTPRFALEKYEGYEMVTCWFYLEGLDGIQLNLPFLDDGDSNGKGCARNTWVKHELNIETFKRQILDWYLIAAQYNDALTGIRLGEVFASNSTSYTLENLTAGILTQAEDATVSFDVVPEDKDIPYIVSIVNSENKQVWTSESNESNKYSCRINATGEYTLRVSSAKPSVNGTTVETFKITRDRLIVVDGEYGKAVELNNPLNIYQAEIQNTAGVTQSGVVNVKVYNRNGAEWKDETANIVGGVYTPKTLGAIKIEYTYEGADTLTYELGVVKAGEVFNPASETATTQFTNALGLSATFVSEEENEDETYSGAYLSYSPYAASGWLNCYLSPSLDVSAYAKYDTIILWIYVAGTAEADGKAYQIPCLDDNECAIRGLELNKWNLVSINIDKFSEKILTQYLFALRRKSFTEFRIGEITAVKDVSYTVENLQVGTVGATGAAVSFNVTSSNPEIAYSVAILNADGKTVWNSQSNVNNRYSCTIDIYGDYTIKIDTVDALYGGSLEHEFTVLNEKIIKVDEYKSSIEQNVALTIKTATLYVNDAATSETVTVKVYTYTSGAWVDDSANILNGVYTPTAIGKLKVEYSYEGAETVIYEINVITAVYKNVIVLPLEDGSLGSYYNNRSDNVTNTFVTAEDNNDTVYGGAYVRHVDTKAAASSKNMWPQIRVKESLMDSSSYDDYDAVVGWVRINGTAQSFWLQVADNNAKYSLTVNTNEWIKVIIDMADFEATAFTGKLYTFPWNDTITSVDIGELKAVKKATYVIDNLSVGAMSESGATVAFEVIPSVVDLPYSVAILNAEGETVWSGSANENNEYSCTIPEAGKYTIKVEGANDQYVGSVEQEFTLGTTKEIKVEDYAVSVKQNVGLILHKATLYINGSATEETVTVKVYTYDGADWVDDSENIVNGVYTPALVGRLKIEYTYEGAEIVTYEIAVVADSVKAGVIFDPTSANATEQFTNNQSLTPMVVTPESAYNGAYLKYAWTDTFTSNNHTGFMFANKDYSAYNTYEKVQIWLYLIPGTTDTSINIDFVGKTTPLAVNAWNMVELDVATFTTRVEAGSHICSINRRYIKQFYIGKITAVGTDMQDVVVFDPASANATTQWTNNRSLTPTAVAADGIYNGSYLKYSFAATASNSYLKLVSTNMDFSALEGYDKVQIWVYIVPTTTMRDIQMNLDFAGVGTMLQTYQWNLIEMDAQTFISRAQAGEHLFAPNMRYFTEFRIGTITAVKTAE